MSRKNTVAVLMKRDGITREAADERIRDGYEAVMEALETGGDPWTAWEEEMGLELDYFEDCFF